MGELQVIERVMESSPAIVVVLLGACVMLWRTLREEIASCRALHGQSIEAQHKLADAVNQLASRIQDSH